MEKAANLAQTKMTRRSCSTECPEKGNGRLRNGNEMGKRRLTQKRKFLGNEARAQLLIALLTVSNIVIELLSGSSFYNYVMAILRDLEFPTLEVEWTISLHDENQGCCRLKRYPGECGTMRWTEVSKMSSTHVVFYFIDKFRLMEKCRAHWRRCTVKLHFISYLSDHYSYQLCNCWNYNLYLNLGIVLFPKGMQLCENYCDMNNGRKSSLRGKRIPFLPLQCHDANEWK